jgi:hypothetical protein
LAEETDRWMRNSSQPFYGKHIHEEWARGIQIFVSFKITNRVCIVGV